MPKDTSLIGKIARSKDGNKLGEIIRVEGELSNFTVPEKLMVVIETDRPLADSDLVQVLLEKLNKVDDNGVIFDISIDEFKKRQLAYRFLHKQQIE